MSVWIDANKELPPLDEEVVILYKDKTDKLESENLFYGVAYIYFDSHLSCNRWSHYTEYQGYYEVVYWARIYDKPHIERDKKSRKGNIKNGSA